MRVTVGTVERNSSNRRWKVSCRLERSVCSHSLAYNQAVSLSINSKQCGSELFSFSMAVSVGTCHCMNAEKDKDDVEGWLCFPLLTRLHCSKVFLSLCGVWIGDVLGSGLLGLVS